MRDHTIPKFRTPIKLDLEMDLASSLEFSEKSGLSVVSYLLNPSLDDTEALDEVNTPFKDLIDECLEVGKFTKDYQSLYCIAHELNRFSEQFREVAANMEDSVLILDLFDIDPEKDLE